MSACIACDICGEHQGDGPTFRFNVLRPITHGVRRSEGDACHRCATRLAAVIDGTPENVEEPSPYYTNEFVQVDRFGRPTTPENVEEPT